MEYMYRITPKDRKCQNWTVIVHAQCLRTAGRMRDERVSHKFDRSLTSRANKPQNIIYDDINAYLLVSRLLSFVIASETAVQVCRNDFPLYSLFNIIILMGHNFLCTQTASTTSQLFLWACEVMTRHSVMLGGGGSSGQSKKFTLFCTFWRILRTCDMHIST